MRLSRLSPCRHASSSCRCHWCASTPCPWLRQKPPHWRSDQRFLTWERMMGPMDHLRLPREPTTGRGRTMTCTFFPLFFLLILIIHHWYTKTTQYLNLRFGIVVHYVLHLPTQGWGCHIDRWWRSQSDSKWRAGLQQVKLKRRTQTEGAMNAPLLSANARHSC